MTTNHFVRYFRGCTVGWVVRVKDKSSSWWYGPRSGWGTTYGTLDTNIPVFDTKRDAQTAVRSVYGRVASRFIFERITDSVAIAINEAQTRKREVLASDRPDRQSIADANDAHIAYLTGTDQEER